jgi:TM2 domain-containing membrane protein YozV
MPDLRKYAQQTKNRLMIGLLVLVFTLGLALIYFLYGPQAALLGLICLAGILIPLLIILGILTVIERLTKNDR